MSLDARRESRHWITTPLRTGAITLGTGNLANPAIFNQPSLPDFRDRFHAQQTSQQAITVGDTIGFTDALSVQLAASQSWIRARNINRAGVVAARYRDDGISPAASLILKPSANTTTYLT